MSLFILLPEDVLVDLLSKWLSAPVVCRLDCACCNKQSRSVLLRVLKLISFSKLGVSFSRNMFRWMITREIKCREIVYGSLQARIVGDSGLELALASTGQSITSFTFVSDKGRALPRFQPTHGSIRLLAKYCRDLRNFSCYYVRFPSCASGSDLFYNCKQLRNIDFNLVSSLPADFLDACFSAPHLTNLTMVKCNLSEQLYTLETSATIRSLTFSETRLTVKQVLQLCEHCPNLVNLFIESHTGFLDVVEIAYFAPCCKSAPS